jgi:hypothetical protein
LNFTSNALCITENISFLFLVFVNPLFLSSEITTLTKTGPNACLNDAEVLAPTFTVPDGLMTAFISLVGYNCFKKLPFSTETPKEDKEKL